MYFVSEHVPEEVGEQWRFYKHLQWENNKLEEHEWMNVWLTKDSKLLVNNEVLKQTNLPPELAEILTIGNDEIQSTRKFKLNQGPTVLLSKVKPINEVRKRYHKIKIQYGDVTHIAAAFQLSNARGSYSQERLNDGKLGAGRSILKVLKQKNVEGVCVFIVH